MIAVGTTQPELQIEDERIRRYSMPALQEARKILDTALARTAYHDHLVRSQVVEPQPPIPFLLIRLYENKIRTRPGRVHPLVTPQQLSLLSLGRPKGGA